MSENTRALGALPNDTERCQDAQSDPYSKSKPDGFRRIHRALQSAHREGRTITLTILENVLDAADRNHRERALIGTMWRVMRPLSM